MTLKEKLENMIEDTERIRGACPEVVNVSWAFENVPLAEIRELSVTAGEKAVLADRKGDKVLKLYIPNVPPFITCFCYSVPVKVVQPEVEEIQEVGRG